MNERKKKERKEGRKEERKKEGPPLNSIYRNQDHTVLCTRRSSVHTLQLVHTVRTSYNEEDTANINDRMSHVRMTMGTLFLDSCASAYGFECENVCA